MEGFVEANLRFQLVDEVLLLGHRQRQPEILGHAQRLAAVRQAVEVFAEHTALRQVGALAQCSGVTTHVGAGTGDLAEEVGRRGLGLACGVDDQLERLLQVVELQLGQHHADLQRR